MKDRKKDFPLDTLCEIDIVTYNVKSILVAKGHIVYRYVTYLQISVTINKYHILSGYIHSIVIR